MIATAIMTGAAMSAQTVIIVDNNSTQPGVATDLQTAINSAAAGSTIYVQPSSTSYGNVEIAKKITLVGAKHSGEDLSSKVGTISLINGAKDTVIKGLTTSTIYNNSAQLLENITVKECNITSMFGLSYNSTSNNPKNWVIEGNNIANLYAYYNVQDVVVKNNIIKNLTVYKTATMLVTQNIFLGNGSINYYDESTGNKMVISNSIFLTNSRAYGNTGATITGRIDIQNSLTYNYGTSGVYNFAESTTDNYVSQYTGMKLNQDPKFVFVNPAQNPANAAAYSIANDSSLNFETDNLKLQATSPAKGAGVAGEDLGLYQNYDFRNVGNPFGIPTLKIGTYSSSVPAGSNLSVSVTAKAQ